MRIAMISNYVPSNSKIGAGYWAHYLSNELVKRGHDVTVFSPGEKSIGALYKSVIVPVGKSLRTFRFAWNLRRYDFSGYDIVHAQGDDYLFRKNGAKAHLRTMCGSCIAETFHIRGFKEKLRMALLGVSEILATFVADRTVCISENTRAYYPWLRDVIPCGVDTAAFAPKQSKSAHPTILFVGTYENRKRGRLLHEAFTKTILPIMPSAELWMVCSDAPTTTGVTVFGRVSVEKLSELYATAWVFCLPSEYEGFGIPYVEALASGNAIVATPNVGALEVLENGKFGIISEPAQLGKAVLTLLQNENSQKELVRAGLLRSKDYSWDKVISQYEQVYRELLKANGHS